MTNAERYIDQYKKLEEAVRQAYHLRENDSISYFLKNRREFSEYAEEIKYCQEVRNLLQHRRKIDGQYPVEPSESMIHFAKMLTERVNQRPLCLDIAKKAKKLYSCSPRDHVAEAIEVMRSRSFTQVPILKDGRVIGVFDARSLFSYLADQPDHTLAHDLTFQDLISYTDFEKRSTEIYTFHPKTMYVDELQDEFDRQYHKGRRIVVAFLTENGRREERILGMLTPWDVIANLDR